MRSPDAGVPLASFTTIGVGGAARWYAHAESADDVAAAHVWAGEHDASLTVLAGGSNVVVADEGCDGLVVRVCTRGISHVDDGDDVVVRIAAGESWDGVVAWAVAQGLAGIECLSGIPGSVGGTPIQNVGAYGQDVSQTIESVLAFDRQTASMLSLTASDCEFAYRSSRFKARESGRFVVCEVSFRLRHGGPTVTYPDLLKYFEERSIAAPTLADARDAVLAVRRGKGMVLDAADVDTRSVGSFFTNPVIAADVVDAIARRVKRQVPAYPAGPGRMKVPAAWLLEQAGFGRGYGTGTVGLSSKHPLAVINRGGASAKAVVAFAAGLKRRVAEEFGVSLFPEPTFVGFGADDDVRYLVVGNA